MTRHQHIRSTRTRRLYRPAGLGPVVLAMAVGIAAAFQPATAAVKTRVQFDKTFDFRQARTWGWNAEGAGNVIVARTAQDDPEAIKSRAEPIILEAVRAQISRRGLELATGVPDVTLTYYLLLSIGDSSQTLGQFLPAVTGWGLPPFAPSTTSLEMIEQGSLVLDLSAAGKVVWRGIAEAQIKMDLTAQQREALLREAVREVLERFPPRS